MNLIAQKTEISPIEDYISTDYNPHSTALSEFFMFSFYLPFKDKFLDIFQNHEIRSWQAKQFWLKFDDSICKNEYYLRQQVYAGLKILVKHGYLSYERCPKNCSIFLYSETNKIKEIFNKTRDDNNLKNIIENEIKLLNNDLCKLMKEKNLVENLLYKYPKELDGISKILEKIHSQKQLKENNLEILKYLRKYF